MRKLLFLNTLLLALFVMGACSDDDPVEGKAPTVSFANEEGIFEVKVGRSITIEPVVTDVTDPFYVWKLDGEIVSRDVEFEFSSKTIGSYFLTFQVSAMNGIVEEEIRIDVLELTPPRVVLPVEGGNIPAIIGQELKIVPDVTHDEDATYQWLLNREEVSTDSIYVFKQDELGDYPLVLIVTNEDGEGRAEAIVRVGEVPELSFFFENEEILAPEGRDVVIAPYISYATANTTYEWQVDGVVQMGQNRSIFRFNPSKLGTRADAKTYEVKVTATDGEDQASATVTVKAVPEEGTYKRLRTSSSSEYLNKVYCFLPAPGQFVNEGYLLETQEAANDYAMGRLKGNGYVSLGGFGGYIVVGFDHSIENKDGYNLAIQGNAFAGSSEPGVVWVMQDENGNGLPDDTWYELKGSEFGKPETRQLYACTYFKPTGSREDVRWTDNYGDSGTVDINQFHSQDSYYPNWVTSASYTLRGTCLKSKTYDQSGNGTYWVNPEFDWGYVDNFSDIDYVSGETYFNLDNAIYPDGTPVNLEYIDFVKVHTGVNTKAGWLGENSTEVLGFRDINK